MRIRLLPTMPRLPGRAQRGCVPHLPAPGCPPERPLDAEPPCFPILDVLTGSRDVRSPERQTPTTGRRGHGRSRR